MNENTKNATNGFGSYIALIVMVWFAMSGSPWYLVFPIGILNGILFAFIAKGVVAFLVSAYQVEQLLYEMHFNSPSERDIRITDAYLAYIYEQAKLSDLSKRIS